MGDVVSHSSWGVGRVVEVAEGPCGDIIVEFRAPQDRRRMSQELASRALARLPANGLEALLLADAESARQWSQEAPLKLVAAALADFGRAAKPSELQTKLMREGLLQGKWETWWRRVQPALKQSPYFRVRLDGTYQLNAPVDQIPESPLPSAPRRPKAAPMDRAQLDETVRALESGELRFDTIDGADNIRLVAREMIRRGPESQQARDALFSAMSGPTILARTVFDELLRSERIDDIVAALDHLIHHSLSLARSPSSEVERRIGELLLPKIRLMQDVMTRLVQREQPVPLARLGGSIRLLFELAAAVGSRTALAWASESLDNICNILAAHAERYPEVLEIVGRSAAGLEGDLSGRVEVLARFTARVPAQVRPTATTTLLLAALDGPTDFAQACFSGLVSWSDRLGMLSALASRVAAPGREQALQILGRLLSMTGPELAPQERRNRLRLALVFASAGYEAERAVAPLVREDLATILDDDRSVGRDAPILDSIVAVLRDSLGRERQEFERIRSDLDSEIARLRGALEEATREQSRLKGLAEKLQAGYRMPEQWAMFRGKQDTVQGLASFYQETFLAHAGGRLDPSAANWILARIEALLQGSGITKFGEVGSDQAYEPSRHEYLAGYEGIGQRVKVVCPGFEWQDPTGSIVVLARARVVRS